jgi:hypothetical protein
VPLVSGLIIGDFDLIIAATALQYDLRVLTNNRQHFERGRGLRPESLYRRIPHILTQDFCHCRVNQLPGKNLSSSTAAT